VRLPIVLALLLLAGCQYRPVVDQKMSTNPERFDADLVECRQIAEGGGGGQAAGGAAGGAVVGGALAIATGRPDRIGQAAGGGAVIGGARGAGASGREKRAIVRNCLKGRGHAVLN
jgi:outer membrane lipoprotein SlyB